MLRIGLMLDSFQGDAWIAQILADIRASGFAEIALVVVNTPAPGKDRSLRQSIKAHWKHTLFDRYTRWDRERNQPPQAAQAPADFSHLLEGVPSLRVEPLRQGSTDRFREEDLQQIRAANLDVLLRFGFRIVRGPILQAARYGVWSFHHGDNLEYRGAPPHFWEIYENNPVSGSMLQVLTDTLDGGHVLYRSHAATNLASLALNREPIYWKSAEFVLRRLRDLHRYGPGFLEALPTYNEDVRYTRRSYRTPDTPQMLFFIAGQLWRRLRANLVRFMVGSTPQWFLAMRRRSTAGFSDPTGYHLIQPPRDRFYADPFLFDKDGKTFLFFEDYPFATRRGHISCAEVNPDGSLTPPVEVLRRPYHLSYPLVFEHAGEIYMLPETLGNRTVELYRAAEFPHQWAPAGVLLRDIYAVDATIQKLNGKLWMFVGLSNGRYSSSDELALFYADDLFGPWTPHPLNPVVSDVRRARPAGALFYDEGRLIRPSQDCSKAYGYALNFCEVLVLDETRYEERPIARIEPHWLKNNQGTHSYSRSSQFEAIDGKIFVKPKVPPQGS